MGFDAWAVDHKGSRLVPETPALFFLDLTIPEDICRLQRLLQHPLLVYVHFSPPCGTCSRAREIAVPGLPGGGPPPVRSEAFPLGFPDLAERLPREHPRVQAANAIYKVIANVANDLIARGVAWSIENPSNSILWHIPFMRDLLQRASVAEVKFQHCMYGGLRDKWTSFWHYPCSFLEPLRCQCDW